MTVQFAASVDIKSISFCTKVLSKQTIGFSIFTYSSVDDARSNSQDIGGCRVAQVYTKMEDNVCLINAHYKHYAYYNKFNMNNGSELRYCGPIFNGFLRHCNHLALRNVRVLQIRLLKNLGNSCCALKSLAVIGQPGSDVTIQERTAVMQAWERQINIQNNARISSVSAHDTEQEPTTSKDPPKDDIGETFTNYFLL